VSSPAGPRGYALFDRVVWSERPLRLLRQLSADEAGERPVGVRIHWSDDPVVFAGEVVAGGPATSCSVARSDDGWSARLNGTGFVARVHSDGSVVTVHPEAGEPASQRRPADALVTGVLTRVPMAWGCLPLHCAVLQSPKGLVLLAGRSGRGKSTLAQHLRRRLGWGLLDDDGAMACEGVAGFRVVPMGSRPRLRADAAQLLGVHGEPLGGYQGDKVAGEFESQDPTIPQPIAAMCHLKPERPALDLPVAVDLLPAATGVREAVEVAIGLDRSSRTWQELRFSFAASVTAPSFAVRYRRGVHSPDEVVHRLAEALS